MHYIEAYICQQSEFGNSADSSIGYQYEDKCAGITKLCCILVTNFGSFRSVRETTSVA